MASDVPWTHRPIRKYWIIGILQIKRNGDIVRLDKKAAHTEAGAKEYVDKAVERYKSRTVKVDRESWDSVHLYLDNGAHLHIKAIK